MMIQGGYLMKRIIVGCVIFCMISFPLIGCNRLENKSNNKVTVAVSIIPEEAFVKKIAGDAVNVVCLIPPGNSPANYEPTLDVMKDISKSSTYFTIDVPAEKSIIQKVREFNKDIEVINLAEDVREKYDDRVFEDGGRDPHIWLSPKRVIVMVESIKAELIKIDVNNKEIYEENANKFIDELNELDRNMKSSLNSGKSFLIYHPSLGYIAEDYGIKMLPIEKEGKEPSIKEIKRVVEEAKNKNITDVLCQAEFDIKEGEVIAKELGGEVKIIEPLSENYIESMNNILSVLIEAAK